jgi:hypothetical protein
MVTGKKTSLLLAALFAGLVSTAGVAEAGKPTIGGPCTKCHTAEADAVRGKLGTVSEKLKTLQVKAGNLVWIVKYDDKTSVTEGEKTSGADAITKLKKGKEILVSFTGGEAKPVATDVSVKQPYKVPEEQKITNDEVAAIVAKGSGYTLVDCRPPGAYLGGHIPTAISLPFDKFKENYTSALPAEKDSLLIFYCGGPT